MPFLKHNLPYTEPLWHESDRKAQKDGYRSTFYYTNRYSNVMKGLYSKNFEEMNTGECGKTTSDTDAVVIIITRERFAKIFSSGK